MNETQQVSATAKPFVCHGESHPGPTMHSEADAGRSLGADTGTIRKVIGRWPTLRDLADHIHCGRCAALGRKASLRFYRYPQTVVEMERRRAERTMAARQAFKRYL